MAHQSNPATWVITLALVAAVSSCGPADREPAPVAPEAKPAPPIIDVEAAEYAFTAPPTFPSGWVTPRFTNAGEQDHFLIFWKLPEGRTFDEYASDVAGVFSDLYAEYRAGTYDQAQFMEKLGGSLPEWFFNTRRLGGPGFTAPGHTSETTVHLEPGDYVMECYVRSAEKSDTFHGGLGMLRPLIVTDETSGAQPPPADVEIQLSNYKIAVEGELSAGPHTARVRVAEDPEGLILHNVQLARLNGDASAEEAAAWLDWVDHMVPPAPAEFLGGAGQSQAGAESYFHFNLEPGRYAWISEAWGTTKGMIHEFTVE
jgi:hypothetical protein